MDLNRDVLEILSDLISVESVTGNEKDICDLLYDTLSSYAGELIRVNNSLVYHTKFSKEKTVALIGHLDTVPIEKSSTKPVIKGGELWGRGACDMKAGLAVMLKIIHEISSGKILPKYNLTFVFYEGEEGPIPNGINTIIDNKHLDSVDFAFILEPTEGRYSIGCLGSLAIRKEFLGISAHSANPRTGKNALKEALEVFNKIEEMNSRIGKDQELDGHRYYETVNVTTMNTFNAFNVIPQKAEIIINYRFAPGKTGDEAMEELYNIIGRDGATMLDQAESCYIGNSGDDFLLEGYEKEIMQAWTDIAQLNEAGIPAINFGPGSIKHAHKPDERLSIQELNVFYSSMVKHI